MCPAGTTNDAGDDASGDDTECDATLCKVNEHVVSHVCTTCPDGTIQTMLVMMHRNQTQNAKNVLRLFCLCC